MDEKIMKLIYYIVVTTLLGIPSISLEAARVCFTVRNLQKSTRRQVSVTSRSGAVKLLNIPVESQREVDLDLSPEDRITVTVHEIGNPAVTDGILTFTPRLVRPRYCASIEILDRSRGVPEFYLQTLVD
jgi:hypothetical protein